MHTLMTSETPQTNCAAEPEAPVPSEEQAIQRGIPLSQNAQDQEPYIYIYIPSPDKIFIL